MGAHLGEADLVQSSAVGAQGGEGLVGVDQGGGAGIGAYHPYPLTSVGRHEVSDGGFSPQRWPARVDHDRVGKGLGVPGPRIEPERRAADPFEPFSWPSV